MKLGFKNIDTSNLFTKATDFQFRIPFWQTYTMKQALTLNCASKSACPSIIPISSFMRSGGAFSPNMLKLVRKSINILNSAPVTSAKLWNKPKPN